MASWRWENRPPLTALAAPKPLVQRLRRTFPEALYQLYTPNGTPDEHRVYYVTSNADDSPYEAWITATALRNNGEVVDRLLETRMHDPDAPVCREVVRDDTVIALDIAGATSATGSVLRLETYACEDFPEKSSGSKDVSREIVY